MPEIQSASASGNLPSTGNADFDKLVQGTQVYAYWLQKVLARGFSVVPQSLPTGTAAWIEQWTITFDPSQFRYIDLLHEARHTRQIERAWWQGFDVFGTGKSAKMLRGWFELGAYEYEQRIGQRFGFTAEYMEFLAHQIDYYWKRTYRQELKFSRTTRDQLSRIWR